MKINFEQVSQRKIDAQETGGESFRECKENFKCNERGLE